MTNLYKIPYNRTTLTRPVIMSSKLIARRRDQATNLRKLQTKVGNIVYLVYGRNRGIQPMRVVAIDDCSLWARSATYKNRHRYMIYYDLQPLTQQFGEWRAKPWRSRRLGWRAHNQKLWESGWIGHSVDFDEFTPTYPEARWMRLYYCSFSDR